MDNLDKMEMYDEIRTEFIEKVFEIAFGDDAKERGYSYDDVINRLQEFSDNSLKMEEESERLDKLAEIDHADMVRRNKLADGGMPEPEINR